MEVADALLLRRLEMGLTLLPFWHRLTATKGVKAPKGKYCSSERVANDSADNLSAKASHPVQGNKFVSQVSGKEPGCWEGNTQRDSPQTASETGYHYLTS